MKHGLRHLRSVKCLANSIKHLSGLRHLVPGIALLGDLEVLHTLLIVLGVLFQGL